MKGNRNPPPPASGTVPPSPTSKGTAKYTNKDGSKFITVPKMNTPVDSAQPSPTTASSPAAKAATHPASGTEPAQPVNRKKQKRRAKAAAKAAAEQAQSNPTANGIPSPPRTNDQQSADADHEDDEEEPTAHQDRPPYQNGVTQDTSGKTKKSKKKKKKHGTGTGADEFSNENEGSQHGSRHSPAPVPPPPPPPPQHDRPTMSREKIWNTNSQEERERIKEFWLGLSETERKSLVKVEKDAVLKKMKEQQKHTCSCTVCGRKRTAIEEELEGLYDAYYEELEQYANHPNQGDGPPMLRPRRSFGSMGGMRARGLHSRFSNHQPSRGRIMDDLGDEGEDDAEVEDEDEGEEEVEDVYSEEELEDDMYSEEEQEPSEELHRSDYASDFFSFGNSLTVQGGILTVADDLLKNDGKKFIEMMEQLAERRMAREEDARSQFDRGYEHANGDRYGHSHPPPPDEEEFEDDEEEYEEDDEEDYDSQDEEDTMTEEQRMEEGRRMFQIFAARMFEQRVLTAYREKVAKERQAKLLEEIEAENQQDAQRKAKKAKDAQRRKDRAAKKKEALAEEKARKEAEKAAEEAARRVEEARKAEEQRIKAEEKRKKKEAQRKAEEEERQRKEAERLRKLQEREENERKAREAKEREKRAREQKEKEAREQREREARERKEQQERERREKETKAKAEREAREAKAAKEAKEAKDTKEKRRKEERAAQKAATLAAAVPVPVTLPKRTAAQQPPPTPIAAVPVLPQQAPKSYASPQITVATPALPKAPTPMRARQPSQQESSTISPGVGSNPGSLGSQNPSPHPITPVHASPGPIAPPSKAGTSGASLQNAAQPLSHTSSSPMSFPAKSLPPQHGPFGMPPMGAAMSFPPGLSQFPPGFGNPVHRDPVFPPMPGFRPAPGMMPMPPGFGSPGGNRGFPMHPPPGFHGPMDSPVPSMAQMMGPGIPKDDLASHSRQGSGSFDAAASQPISRPTPIGRPASVVQGQRPASESPLSGLSKPEPDAHLGSRALLDDVDDGLQDFPGRLSRGASAPGPRPVPGFPMAPFGMDPIFSHNPWGPPNAMQPNPFGPLPPPGFGHSPLSVHAPVNMPWGHPMPPTSTFGAPGIIDRPIEPRSVAVRKMLRRACEELADAAHKNAEGKAEASDNFVALDQIKTQVEMLNHGHAVDEKELLDICETEGNDVNGGGSFDVRDDDQGGKSIRFVSGNERPTPQPVQKAVGYHPSSPIGGSGAGPSSGNGGNQVGGSR